MFRGSPRDWRVSAGECRVSPGYIFGYPGDCQAVTSITRLGVTERDVQCSRHLGERIEVTLVCGGEVLIGRSWPIGNHKKNSRFFA
jgi:hypothetical protein